MRAHILLQQENRLLHVGRGGVWDYIYDSTANNQGYMLYQIITSFAFILK